MAAAALVWASWTSSNRAGGFSAPIQDRLTAAALLENSRLDEAISSYKSLVRQDPKNAALAINLSVALVSKIKDQSKVAEDAVINNKNSESAMQARTELDDLVLLATSEVERAMTLSKSKSAPYQLAIELASVKIASQSKRNSEKSLMELLTRIIAFEKESPGDPYLATSMPDLIEQLPPGKSNSTRNAVAEAIRILKAAFEKHPRNLYVLNRLISLLITNEDKIALDLIDPMVPLCQPLGIEGTENEVTAILLEAKQAITEDSDLAMALLEQSQNLIIRTSAFRADERATRPNTLALIDFSDVQESLQKSVQQRTPRNVVDSIPQFFPYAMIDDKSAPISGETVCWFDWNIDLEPELLWIYDKKLMMGSWISSKPKSLTVLASLEIPEGVHTIRTIDLFEVQFATRPQRDYQKRKAEMSQRLSEQVLQQTLDRRADTIRDIVLIGSSGIHLVTLEDVVSASNEPPFKWHIVQEKTGLESIISADDCLPIDWDADGDLDLVVASNGKIVLMQNRGNRTFDNVNTFSTLPEESFHVQAISVCDYDRDQDLDVLVSSSSGAAISGATLSRPSMGVLENILHGQFRFRTLDGEWGKLAGAKSLAFAELDGNLSWDWLAVQPEGMEVVYTSTTSVGRCRPMAISTLPKLVGLQIQVADFNNDGGTDAMLWGGNQLEIVWNNGKLGFHAEPTSVLSSKNKIASVSIADIDQDGSLDAAAIVDGQLQIVKSNSSKTNRYTQVRLKGINDENGGGRVNQYGMGSIVEIFSPDRYQAQVVKDDYCHFGLGNADKPYNLRVVFTNGLTQNVLNPAINTVIEEKQILKGSCPFAYGWDGTRWMLITDLLWNAPLGLQVNRGKTLPDRRWEHLLVPGALMQPREEGYELRVTEELWETAYFDQIELTAVDHPIGTWLYSNEKVGPPLISEQKLWLVDKRIPVNSVIDSDNKNWTAQMASVDQNYALPFLKHYCQGNVSKHYLELDLSDIEDVEQSQLYLTGWIFPTDTSLNIGLDQNPNVEHPVPPSLWSEDSSGEFTCVQPFMGFPGGKPKTIVIPLQDVFQSNTRRLRIETSCEIYWDEVFVAFGTADDPRLSIEKLSLAQAHLQYRGFSAIKPRRPDQHHDYDYQAVSPHAAWPPMDGLFTDYGDVVSLLASDDDRLVVMGSGDEVQLRFTMEKHATSLKGMQRDFILSSIGWDKDADLNTLEGQSSLPLPFASMKSYPPPFSQHEESVKVEKLNKETMHRSQSYREYWHR